MANMKIKELFEEAREKGSVRFRTSENMIFRGQEAECTDLDVEWEIICHKEKNGDL